VGGLVPNSGTNPPKGGVNRGFVEFARYIRAKSTIGAFFRHVRRKAPIVAATALAAAASGGFRLGVYNPADFAPNPRREARDAARVTRVPAAATGRTSNGWPAPGRRPNKR